MIHTWGYALPMALNEQEMMQVYQALIRAYPEDLRIARPLIQMLQASGDIVAARELAMDMARRMLSRGYSSYALAFLSICEQLEHPDVDEIASMKTMAELTMNNSVPPESELSQTFKLIEALSDTELQNFLRQGSLRHAKAGDIIVKQGETSQNFYLILEGEVHVQVDTKAGEHFEVGVLKQGDFFGEVSCIYQLPRTATVEAYDDVMLLEFSDEAVDAMMQMSPIAGDSLMKVVQRRMIETVSFTHPAFGQLSFEDRNWLEEDAELVEYLPNRNIHIAPDEDHQCFYVVIFGKLEASRGDAKATLGMNAMYGEAIRVLAFPEGTKLRSQERTLVCQMPIQMFETFYRTYAEFERWVHQHISKRNQALGSSVLLSH